MYNQYQETKKQSKQLADRMRNGTGLNTLLAQSVNPSHYIDSLERFKKDYASMDKAKRDEDNFKRQQQLQKRRLQLLERQNNRWQSVQNKYQKQQLKQQNNVQSQWLGVKKIHNTAGLAYNPINLSYNENPEGKKLQHQDEERQLRRYIRVFNMDHRGNSKFNPINGIDRPGVERVVPQHLNDRYGDKLYNYYDSLKLKVPASSMQLRNNNYHYH